MTLRLDLLDPATEAEVVHAWVVEDRAQFWMMQDYTLEEVREVYTWIQDQPTHAAYLVKDGDAPVGLFQTYDPRAEEIGDHFDVLDGDLGVHLMVGPASEERPGFTGEVLELVGGFVFSDPAVQRVVAEPDARNAKAIARAQSMGFAPGPVVQLSTKPAQLGFITREAYESVFSKNSSA
ncbi:GNAT family N-acetyltransferase [Nocardioides sp.]|uniref:GNAT family N-acetyltransferase n=1 Tax=Nocardioides sp. TaxID=35761 RepID=UPI00271DDE9E|nr:GNAT family N-acetyltransferase [Nocardioides sp.]MDO9457744.1 GNAT family N-acetyltransferase [Nocardioides sp.]